MEGILPQFESGEKIKNVYSFAEVERKVLRYLASALNGTVTGDGELVVNGKHDTVLNRVRLLKPLIEGFFDNMPKVAAALRRNVPLYMPYANRKQLEETRTPAGKIKAMQSVMDNFQYNADLGALNSVKKERPDTFTRKKQQWEQKVGYDRSLRNMSFLWHNANCLYDRRKLARYGNNAYTYARVQSGNECKVFFL